MRRFVTMATELGSDNEKAWVRKPHPMQENSFQATAVALEEALADDAVSVASNLVKKAG